MEEWLEQLLADLSKGEKTDVLFKKYKQLNGDVGMLNKIKAVGMLRDKSGYTTDKAISSVLGEDFKKKYLKQVTPAAPTATTVAVAEPQKKLTQADFGGDPFQKAIAVKTTPTGTTTAVAATDEKKFAIDPQLQKQLQGIYGEKQPVDIPGITKNGQLLNPAKPAPTETVESPYGKLQVDPRIEAEAAASNVPNEEFTKRTVARTIWDGYRYKTVPYDFDENAPENKNTALFNLPAKTDFKQGDIRKHQASPTGYEVFRYDRERGEWVWTPIVKPAKISGWNEEVTVKAIRPKVSKEDAETRMKEKTKNNEPLKDFLDLSESDILKQKLAGNPTLADAVSEEINKNPTKARTGDGRFDVYQKAVAKNYKMDVDPFHAFPTVDPPEFHKFIKQAKNLEKVKELSDQAKNLAAKYAVSKNPKTMEEYNAIVDKMQEYKPLLDFFARKDVSDMLHLMALQDDGEKEIASALNYFPGYREKVNERENKKLEEEGAASGAGKSFAKGTLDLLANMAYGAWKVTPGTILLDQLTDGGKFSDSLKDNYDQWANATFQTGRAKSDFLSFVNSALQTTPQILGIMLTRNPVLGQAVFMATPAFGASYSESLTQGLSQPAAYAKGIVDAAIEVGTEQLVNDHALAKGFKPSKELSELGLKSFGTKEFNTLFRKEVGTYLATRPYRLAKDYAGQMSEEVSAMLLGRLSNSVANALTGSEFQTQAVGDEEKNLAGSMALITLGMKTIGRNWQGAKAQGYRNIILKNADTDFDGAMAIVQSLKENPDIDPRLVQKIEMDLTKLATLKFSKNSTPEQKIVLMDEMAKLKELQDEKENTEKALHEPIDEKIKEQQVKITGILGSPKLAKEMLDKSIQSTIDDLHKTGNKQSAAYADAVLKLTGKTTEDWWKERVDAVNDRDDLTPEEKEAEKERITYEHGKWLIARHTEKGTEVFTDFDDTVSKDGKLTPLGEELKKRAAAGEKITVLTAREDTPANRKYIADQLGIPEDQVKLGLDAKGKAALLTEGSTYYNENAEELEAGRGVQGVKVVDTKIGATPVEIKEGEEKAAPVEVKPAPVEEKPPAPVKFSWDNLSAQTDDVLKEKLSEVEIDLQYEKDAGELARLKSQKRVLEEMLAKRAEKPAPVEEKPPATEEEPDQDRPGVASETFTGKNVTEINDIAAKHPEWKVRKLYKNAANAIKAWSKLMPKMAVTLHHSKEEFAKEVLTDPNATQEDAYGSRGFYVSSQGIHINVPAVLKRGVADEVFHEAGHPLLDMILKNNPAALDKHFSELLGLEEVLPGVSKAIDFGVEGDAYQGAQKKKEAIIQFITMVADREIALDDLSPSALDRVGDFIKRFLNAIGFNYQLKTGVNQSDSLVDVAKKFSYAMQKGKALRFNEKTSKADPKEIKSDGETIAMNVTMPEEKQWSKGVKLENTREHIKQVDRKTLSKKRITVIPSDRLYAGKRTNEESGNEHDALGGFFFLDETGKVWASSNDTKANAILDNLEFDKDGLAHIAIMIMGKNSHMSNVNSFEYALDTLKASIEKDQVKLNDVIKRVNDVLNKPAVAEELGEPFKVSGSADDVINTLRDKFEVNEANFGARIKFLQKFFGETVVEGKTTVWGGLPTFDVISDRLEEPLVKNVPSNHIIGYMTVSKDIDKEKIPKGEPGHHKSYPITLKAKSAELFMLNESIPFYEFAPKLYIASRDETITWKQYLKKYKGETEANARYGRMVNLQPRTVTAKQYSKGDASAERYNLNLTPATDKPIVPEIAKMYTEAQALFADGKYKEANALYDQILDKGEVALKKAFKNIDGAEIKLQRTKGNYMGGEEPSFSGELTITNPKNRQAAFSALAAFAKNYSQRTIHISQIHDTLPEGAVFGKENPDGSIYEPNVDIGFENALTDKEYKEVSDLVQSIGKEQGNELAGSTLHPDGKGITLYNISKFKNHAVFAKQVGQLLTKLHDSGRVPSSVDHSVRQLWNYGEAEDGATRTFEELEQGHLPNTVPSQDRKDRESDQGRHNTRTDVEQADQPGTSGSETERSLLNNSTSTQKFFSDTVNGANQPKKKWSPLIALSGAAKRAYNIWSRFRGSFDTHIETSIPAFRDVQIKKISAIADLYKGGGLVIDLMGSEGGFGKAITTLSSKVKSINLDMNPDMQKAHNKNRVAGAGFALNAFGEDVPMDDGTVAKKYVPEKKADVVHESMGFQFIKADRKGFIDEVADNYIKPDGVFIVEEKVLLSDAVKWRENEDKKDKDFKSQYYDDVELAKKREVVLVGMESNQASEQHLTKALSSRFDYVYQYWSAGNFKGYIASNSKEKAQAMLNAIGDTTTDYTSDKEPLVIEKPQYSKGEQQEKKSPVRVDHVPVKGESKQFSKGTSKKRDPVLQQHLDNIRALVKADLKGTNATNTQKVKAVKAVISDKIKQMVNDGIERKVFKGNVKAALLSSVIKRLNAVESPYSALQFVQYLGKMMDNVEYEGDLQQANKIRKQIKSAIKSKVRNADKLTKDMVEGFVRIKPDNVSDIHDYIAIANRILTAATGIKVRSAATGVSVKNPFVEISHAEITGYTKDQQEFADQQATDQLAEIYQELVDNDVIDPSVMTGQEIQDVIDAISGEDEKAIQDEKQQLEEDKVNKVNTLKAVADYQRHALMEIVQDNDVQLTKKERETVRRLLKIDLDTLTGIQLAKYIDVVNNILVNNNFVGAGDIAIQSKMREDAQVLREKLKDMGVEIKKIADWNWVVKHLSSQALFFGFLTKLDEAAAEVQRLIGIHGVQSGNARARDIQLKAVAGYDKLKKGMSKDINSALNRYRRGVYADVMNNFGGTQKEQDAEFLRRVGWIKESARLLRESSEDREQREAILLDHIIDELLEGSQTQDDVKTKMQVIEPDNIRLVKYWQDTYKNRWDDVKENAEIFNNRTTEDVDNYTATMLKGVNNKGEQTDREIDINAQTFISQNLKLNPAGTKIAKVRSKKPPPDRVLNLDFDYVQSKKFFETNYDVETAEHILQAKAFLESDEAADLLGGTANIKLVARNLQKTIALQRGQRLYSDTDDITRGIKFFTDWIHRKSTRLALLSLVQWGKQYLSILPNTIINLGVQNLDLLAKAYTVNVNDELYNLYNISQRGATRAGFTKSVTPAEIEEAFLDNNFFTALRAVNKQSEALTEGLAKSLVKGDVRIARRSWMAFYMLSLRKQGIETWNRDMDQEHLHPNEQAAAYAEQMVSKNQNPNDPSSMANLHRQSNDQWWDMIKNVALPFSTFPMNMRMRMTNDLQKLRYGTPRGRLEAGRSLIATAVEQFIFNYFKVYWIGQASTWAAAQLANAMGLHGGAGGDDDDEAKKDKEEEEKLKKRWLANSISDLFFSGMGTGIQTGFQEGANMLNQLINPPKKEFSVEKNKLVKVYTDDWYYMPNKKLLDYLGIYGIAPKKIIETWKDGKMAIFGETDKILERSYGDHPQTEKIKLTEKEQWVMIYLFCQDALGLIGLSDAEVKVMNGRLRTTANKQLQERTGKVIENTDLYLPPKKQ